MKNIEIEGKTVTMAVERGLAELGLRRDQVEVEVLQEASPGFLGLGAKLAKVKIVEKNWGGDEPRPRPERPAAVKPSDPSRAYAPSRESHRSERRGSSEGRRDHHDDRRGPMRSSHSRRPSSSPRHDEPKHVPPPPPADPGKACVEAKAFLDEVLKVMGFDGVKIVTEWDEAQARVRAELEMTDSDALVGKDGKNLESFQFLTTLSVSRRLKTPVAVQVETAGYWKQREEDILTIVHQAIDEVKRTGKSVRLQPMEASIRRLVHRALANSTEVETVSEGEGSWRKIVLKPKKR